MKVYKPLNTMQMLLLQKTVSFLRSIEICPLTINISMICVVFLTAVKI